MRQQEITASGPLLAPDGRLASVGWSRQPMLDCNLEAARFYRARFLQRWRIKRWDYYGLTTPTDFFSFTIADIGYLGSIFAYRMDLQTGAYHEETLTIPFARGIALPRNSTEGESRFSNGRVSLTFATGPGRRLLSIRWPGFAGQVLSAEVSLRLDPAHESLNIVIPIAGRRFYFNRKANCLPAEGWVEFAGRRQRLRPSESLGNMDWGRGVWEFQSFWVWASASGFLPNGGTVGLNLGFGFGDTSAATENALILDSRLHKLARVDFDYDVGDLRRPWRLTAPDGRVNLEFVPFAERVAKTDLKLLSSEVHQLFGRYRGTVVADAGDSVQLDGLLGFAEEHRARW
jgi:hypothetical protein